MPDKKSSKVKLRGDETVKLEKQAFARAIRNVRQAVADGECSRRDAVALRDAWMGGKEIPEEWR